MAAPAEKGELRITGIVLGPNGPVGGAAVLATSALGDETLSDLVCQCDYACGKPLLECGCAESARQVLALVSERRGEVAPLARAMSGPDGTFTLEGLGAGEVALWAQHASGVAVREHVPAGSEGVELRLSPGRRLSGRAFDEEGRGVAGAVVTAIYAAHSRFFDATTSMAGVFDIGPIPDGRYTLAAAARGFLPASAQATEGVDVVELPLVRPRTLAGTVVRDGKPVANVSVKLDGEHRKSTVTTDKKGQFSFAALHPGDYSLVARQDELGATQALKLESSVSDLVLQLGPAAMVDVLVRDAEGKPLADAKLSAESFGHGDTSVTATTGADGHGKLALFDADRFFVTATRDGFIEARDDVRVVPGRTTNVTLTLRPGVEVSGITVDPTGSPVAHVSIAGRPRSDDEYVAGGWEWARSDGDGGFRLKGLAPGALSLEARADGFLERHVDVVAPAQGVRIQLSRGATISGNVLDPEGRVVPNIPVYAEAITRGRIEADWKHYAMTGDAGEFSLQGFTDGQYFLMASQRVGDAGAQATRRASATVGLSSGESRAVTLSFVNGSAIEGKVVGADGTPIAGMEVRASRPVDGGDDREGWPVESYSAGGSASSDGEGHFSIPGLPGRQAYQLVVDKEGWSLVESVLARPGDSDVVVRLSRQGKITGHVVDEQGNPVAKFTVNRMAPSGGMGHFEVPVSEPGDVSLHFDAAGFAPHTQRVHVERGQLLELGDVALSLGRSVDGTVVDSRTGAPVPKASVALAMSLTAPGDSFMDVFESANARIVNSEDDGSFHLTGLSKDDVDLDVRAQGYVDAHVHVSAASGPVHVALDAGGRILGQMFDAQGVPVAKARVWAMGSNAATSAQGATDSNGSFELAGLVPGEYWVGGQAPWKGASYIPQRVSIADGGTPRVELHAPAESASLTVEKGDFASRFANVLLIAGDVPLPASFSEWRSAGGPVINGRDVGNTSAFVGLPPGTYTLLAISGGRGGFFAMRQLVTLNAGDSQTLGLPPQEGWTLLTGSTAP